MSYRHIENLYRNKEIFLFKQCYASEKINGTSAHVAYNAEKDKIEFFSGGSSYNLFVALFNQEDLLAKFRTNYAKHPSAKKIVFYGESYGGKVQGMSHTYGPNLKFIDFEVLIIDNEIEYWMTVPQAERLAIRFGFEYVSYKLIETTEEAINAEMMADSVQAIRNGMGLGHMREGVVLRPTVELIHPNGGRIISKHKRPEFAEREHAPKLNDPDKVKVMEEANTIADEWVNTERLKHVLDSLSLINPQMEDTRKVISGMVDDVYREAEGEIVKNDDVTKAIGKKTAQVFKKYIQSMPLDMSKEK